MDDRPFLNLVFTSYVLSRILTIVIISNRREGILEHYAYYTLENPSRFENPKDLKTLSKWICL
jgi:hypothetical protein